MTQVVLEIFKEAQRLELGGQFELGNYEEDFLGGEDSGIVEVSISGEQYKVPAKQFRDELRKLKFNHGNLDDIENVVKACISKALA